jgi:hypothetical protein
MIDCGWLGFGDIVPFSFLFFFIFLLLLINPGFHFDNFFLYRVLNYIYENKYLTPLIYKE